MAKFKFIGNGDNDPSDVTAFGMVFRVSKESCEAETDDPHVIDKLRGNSHFEEVDNTPARVDKMNKTQLLAYAKETFDVDLPEGTKAQLLEAISDLADKAKAAGEDNED